MPPRPLSRAHLRSFFDYADASHDVLYLRKHLNSASSPFHPLSTWPHGALRLLSVPELDMEFHDVRVVTTSGCHDSKLVRQLNDFYETNGLSVDGPRRTFMNSHVYSCRMISRHSHKLLAAYTALAFEDATTKAPVLFVQYVAKASTESSFGPASIGDLLFEHMRMACDQCKLEARTNHIMTQSVGYTYDPDPIPDPTNSGTHFWSNRLRITERGLDYMCCLAAVGEVTLKEDCATLHRVFASAPAPSPAG